MEHNLRCVTIEKTGMGDWCGQEGLKMPGDTSKLWHKRVAMQIVTQLPEDPREALTVLAYAKELVENFLGAQEPSADRVVSFPPAASSSRRAN